MAAPTVTITSSAAALAGVQFATITFTLSESSSDFAAGDCVAVNGTLTDFAGSGSVYTATFTATQDFEGLGEVTVAAATFTNGAAEANLAGELSPKITIDTLRPTVAITASSVSLTRGQSSTITFTVSSTPTLFAGEDVSVVGGIIQSFGGTGLVYTATFVPLDNFKGNASVSIAEGKFFDAAGNINVAASLALTVDTEPVVVEVAQMAPDTTVTETMTDKGAIEWTAKESFIVRLDARNSNFVAVADSGLVPQVGDNGNFGRRVLHVHTRTFSYYKNNPMMCLVEVSYVGKQADALTPEPGESQENNEAEPDNAAEDPATWQKITVTTEQRQTLLTDQGKGGLDDGVPALNKAGDPIDGLTEDRALVKMVYADSLVPAPNFAKLLYYVNKINGPGGQFLGCDQFTVRCMGFSADYDQKGNMWSISLEFLYDSKGHIVTAFNAGFNEKVGGNRVAIKTTDGLHPVSKPVLLGADGSALSVADAADPTKHAGLGAILDFYPYQNVSFANIWDDCGLTFVNRF